MALRRERIGARRAPFRQRLAGERRLIGEELPAFGRAGGGRVGAAAIGARRRQRRFAPLRFMMRRRR